MLNLEVGVHKGCVGALYEQWPRPGWPGSALWPNIVDDEFLTGFSCLHSIKI